MWITWLINSGLLKNSHYSPTLSVDKTNKKHSYEQVFHSF